MNDIKRLAGYIGSYKKDMMHINRIFFSCENYIMMPGSKGLNVIPACTGVIMWLNLW